MKRYPDILIAGLWLLAGLVWIASFPPESRLDMDEGVNLMKARLVSDGFELYREIWSDQPPLFTHLLAGWTKLLGETANAARVLVLIFGVLGLISAGRICTWLAGDSRAGMVAVLLILGARYFAKLSLAVMIGLPSIATALLSGWIILLSAGRRHGWIGCMIAGAVFACSMQIKLFSFILAPFLLVLFVTAVRKRAGERRWILQCIVMLLGFALTSACIVPFNENTWPAQLISPHLHQNRAGEESRVTTLKLLAGRLLEDGPLMASALIGVIVAPAAVRRRVIAPGIWFLTSILVLSQANPLWSHHRLMLSLPAAMVAGIGFAGLIEHRTLLHRQWKFAAAAMAVAILVGFGRLGFAIFSVGQGRGDSTAQIINLLRQNSRRGDWIVTDDPFPAYQVGLRVPPQLAVFTYKRLVSGQINDRILSDAIQQYDPPLVMFARFADTSLLSQSLFERYHMIFSNDKDHDGKAEVVVYRRAGGLDRTGG